MLNYVLKKKTIKIQVHVASYADRMGITAENGRQMEDP